MLEHPIMSDTLIACCGSLGYMLPYMRGEYAPHYPMPAIPIKIDLAQAGHWHAVARAFANKYKQVQS